HLRHRLQGCSVQLHEGLEAKWEHQGGRGYIGPPVRRLVRHALDPPLLKRPHEQLYDGEIQASDFFKSKLPHWPLPRCSLWITGRRERRGPALELMGYWERATRPSPQSGRGARATPPPA